MGCRMWVVGCGLCLAAWPLPAQRGKQQTARDLFHSEAGLIVSREGSNRGRFAAAKKGVVAVTLGLKYRIWKLVDEKPVDWDLTQPLASGDQIRLGVEINDTGYLYIVHRQPSGQWRRLFPTSEIEGGNHFVRSGVTYMIPPDDGVVLPFAWGPEKIWMVLAREPVKELEVLVGPRTPENTVSAAPPPEIAESILERVRSLLNQKDLVSERVAAEKAVYVVNRTGQPDSLVLAEVQVRSEAGRSR